MKNQITKDMQLKQIESFLVEELDGKELWGDIAFSIEDYEAIREKLRGIFEGSYGIGTIIKAFPVTITTFMVFMTRYKFNKNFWGLMGSELGIELYPALETEIGVQTRKTFTKYGFDFSDVKDERRVNMEPILYEAGLPPESSLDDLFYILNYDSHSIFDPQLIIEDLIYMRSYHIRQSMLKFLKRYQGDRAIEFVLEVHDAMLAVDQNRSADSRYVSIYSDWKEEEKSKETRNRRKNKEFQTRPYLSFENGKRGLCLVLPRTIMENEWIDDVEWRIVCGDETIVKKRMSVFGDEGRRFIQSIVVPVCSSQTYEVALIDKESEDEEILINWIVDGIKNNGILFFNSNGRMVTPNYLQLPYSIMIFAGTSKVLETKYINTSYQSYPTDRDDYKIVCIEPTGRDAELVYLYNGSRNVLKMRPQINLNLIGKHLFSIENDLNYRLFIEIPELTIEIDEGAIAVGLNLRIGNYVADVTKLFKDGKASISLKKYFKDAIDSYGTYSIRFYQDDHFLRQIEFSYVPKIKTTYSSEMNWPDLGDRKNKKVFKFERKEDWELEFEDCVVSHDEEYYLVECPTDRGSIIGRLKYLDNENSVLCGFELPINPFMIQLLDVNGMLVETVTDKIAKLSTDDINKNEYWVGFENFGEYKNKDYCVRVRTGNGIEQSMGVSLTNNGSGNINLSAFYDTLRNCPLPAQIEISCDENEQMVLPILIISDAVELSGRPSITRTKTSDYITLSLEDDEKDIIVKRFGFDNREWKLSYGSSKINKNGDRRGYSLGDHVEHGLYLVEGTKQGIDFIFEDDTELYLTHGRNITFFSKRKKESPISSFSDWLDQLIKDIIMRGVNQDIKDCRSFHLIKHLNEVRGTQLLKSDYEAMIALAFFVDAKCIDEKKASIIECMEGISREILNAGSRNELIRLLTEIECPDNVFEICLEKYQLLFFMPNTQNAKQLAEKTEKYSLELSMLLLMASDAPVFDTVWREKYREMIGREAIRTMLSVPSIDDERLKVEEQKKFFREKPCKVRIALSREIAGDMGPIRDMVDYKAKIPKLEVSKKPDFGIYFDRIRYVDQYVNWYANSHTKDGEMYDWKRDLMLKVVKNHCSDIMKYIHDLKKTELRDVINRYEKALAFRTNGDVFNNLQVNDHSRYFYLQGLAAFMAKIPSEYRNYGWAVRTGEAFMSEAMKIAPKIARRDLVMASTFIYLVRKEDKLCQ